MKNNSIWMRLGISVLGTSQNIDNIIKGDGNLLAKLLCEGQFEIDGDTYIPDTSIDNYNHENGTQYDETNVDFNLNIKSIELHHKAIIDGLSTSHLEKNEVLVRMCPDTKSPVLIWHHGDGESLCLHNETKEEDLRAVENWLITNGEALNPEMPDLYLLWQQGKAELHIASLNIYSKKDRTSLGGADNVFYNQTSALRYLVDYFIGENMDKLNDVYYVCEARLFSPPLHERQSYPMVESLFDLSAYGEVRPYYSHTVTTSEN